MSIFLENFSIALSALRANKVRSFLTVLGVVIGVFAVITIVAITSGLKDEIVGMVSTLGPNVIGVLPSELGEDQGLSITNSPVLSAFSESEVKEFQQKTKALLKYQTPIYEAVGHFSYGERGSKGFIFGYNHDYFLIRKKKFVAGRAFEKSDEKSLQPVGVLGTTTAEKLFGSPERAIDKLVKVNGKEIKILGVYEKEEFGFSGVDYNQSIGLPASIMPLLFEKAPLIEILAEVSPESEIDSIKKDLEKVMQQIRTDGQFSIFTQETITSLVDQIAGLISIALGGLASISLVVGGIGIMNIMLVSVTERTREIGIRKAVGASNTHILVQFLIEAITLCLLGGVVGLLLAAAISFAITHYTGLPTLINLPTVLGAFSFSVLVGVVFGIAPALRAARKDPIEALRYE